MNPKPTPQTDADPVIPKIEEPLAEGELDQIAGGRMSVGGPSDPMEHDGDMHGGVVMRPN